MLLLLLMVTVLGAAILRLQTAEQRIAVNANNRSIAQANAEATLRYAECGLEGGCGGAAWSPTMFLSNSAGLYTLNTATGSVVSPSSPNTTTSGATWANPLGTTLAYAGPALPTPTTPQYVIEKLPPVVLPGDSMSQEQYNGTGGATPYQITAHANGADASSQATLQSTYRP
jgi:Tfp pilus assembly protein PilX